jgi:hypothetical protein
MAVKLPNGSTQFRTFSKDNLLDTINNNFRVTSKTLGSDNLDEIEYDLDLSRDFRIMNVL